MPVLPPMLDPREIAQLCHDAGWRDLHLVEAVAVCLGESQGGAGSYNDNIRDGKVISRDVGLFEISIDGSKVGTPYEKDLYDPVRNVARARALYQARGWQPWVAWNRGYAMSPDWWRWNESEQIWKPTGRYLHRALKGVANFYALEFKVQSPQDVLLTYRQPPRRPASPP